MVQSLFPTPGQNIQSGPVTLENGLQKGGCVLHSETWRSEVSEVIMDVTLILYHWFHQCILSSMIPEPQQQGHLPAPLWASRATRALWPDSGDTALVPLVPLVPLSRHCGGGWRAALQVPMHVAMAAPAPSWLHRSKAVLESKKKPYVIMLWIFASLQHT